MKRFLINSVTFLRIILGLAFFWVVLFDFNVAFLVLIFILTAISDVSDGWLSRKYGLESDSGAKFDVIFDFIFIMLSTLSLVLIDMIPSWFVLIIVLKMLEFFITSGQSLVYERFGHLVALMFYAFPIFAVLVNDRLIILILAIFITVCALISSAARFRQKFY